jgi:hypothetical protein
MRNLQGTNTLAYLASPSTMVIISFIALATSVDMMNFIVFVADAGLRVFIPAKF